MTETGIGCHGTPEKSPRVENSHGWVGACCVKARETEGEDKVKIINRKGFFVSMFLPPTGFGFLFV